jgi:ribosomal protein L11 methyltransferase
VSEVWAEIEIDAPEALAEAVSAYVALAFGGVEVRDAETLLRPPTAGRVLLVAYVRPDAADALVAETAGRFAGLSHRIRMRDEDEWRDVWKQFFKPRRVGRRLWVRPSWEALDAGPEDLVIEIDPGRAFGTGTHESTQLVLRALEDLPAPTRFLDVGTGSGILAIAAGLLWPHSSGVAIDLDPDAVACARENFCKNQLGDRVATSDRRLDAIDGTFGVVMANLSAEVLFDQVAVLSRRVELSGWLVLSGMLHAAADDVAARYRAAGLSLDRASDQGEWRALVLRAPG